MVLRGGDTAFGLFLETMQYINPPMKTHRVNGPKGVPAIILDDFHHIRCPKAPQRFGLIMFPASLRKEQGIPEDRPKIDRTSSGMSSKSLLVPATQKRGVSGSLIPDKYIQIDIGCQAATGTARGAIRANAYSVIDGRFWQKPAILAGTAGRFRPA
jgi:hypothetical protein